MAGLLPDVAAWSEEWTLAGGERVKVRPIRSADAAIEQAFVRGLSRESRYTRFMGEVAELSPEMLARFTQIHYPHDLALIVTVPDGAGEKEIAVARYIALPAAGACEYAIVVADAWQGHGVGYRLMECLIGFARRGGFERMEGYVLATNQKMIELMRSLGFEAGPSEEGPQVRLLSCVLQEPASNLG